MSVMSHQQEMDHMGQANLDVFVLLRQHTGLMTWRPTCTWPWPPGLNMYIYQLWLCMLLAKTLEQWYFQSCFRYFHACTLALIPSSVNRTHLYAPPPPWRTHMNSFYSLTTFVLCFNTRMHIHILPGALGVSYTHFSIAMRLELCHPILAKQS